MICSEATALFPIRWHENRVSIYAWLWRREMTTWI